MQNLGNKQSFGYKESHSDNRSPMQDIYAPLLHSRGRVVHHALKVECILLWQIGTGHEDNYQVFSPTRRYSDSFSRSHLPPVEGGV